MSFLALSLMSFMPSDLVPDVFFGSKSDAICHLGTLQIAIPMAEQREAEVVLVAWGAERHYQGLYVVAPWAVVHLGNMYIGVH